MFFKSLTLRRIPFPYRSKQEHSSYYNTDTSVAPSTRFYASLHARLLRVLLTCPFLGLLQFGRGKFALTDP